MLNYLRKHSCTTAFLLGWLSVGALPPFNIFPLLFLSLSGLFWLINNAETAAQAFKRGYAFGFAFFAAGFSWIGNALLIEAETFGWLYPVVLIACGFFFGLFIALPAGLTFYFRGLPARFLAFPALWVLFEWLRSFFLTGFPWNLLGSTLSFSDALIQAASLGGTYLLSLIVLYAVQSPALYFCAPGRKNLFYAVFLPVLLLGGTFLYGTVRLSQADKTPSDTIIRLVQPAIPQTLKWREETLENNFRQYIKMSEPQNQKIAFTIWGETAAPYPLDMEPARLHEIQAAVPPRGYLITGLVRYAPAPESSRYRPRNSMFVIAPDGRIAAVYDKSHLVPFGEYIPLRRFLPEWIRPLASVIGTFEPGDGPRTVKLSGLPSLSGLICYEVIFPGQIVDPDNRPQWIVNLTNDGWYGKSAGPYQHLTATRLRAAEEGITIARAANTGISALISPYGQIIAALPLNQKGILDAALPKISSLSTPYGNYGNYFIVILCFGNIVLAFCLTILKLKR